MCSCIQPVTEIDCFIFAEQVIVSVVPPVIGRAGDFRQNNQYFAPVVAVLAYRIIVTTPAVFQQGRCGQVEAQDRFRDYPGW